MFQKLPDAIKNREQHFANLNMYQTHGLSAGEMVGKWWEIDGDIYTYFLEVLPPRYCTGGFRMSELLSGDIAATFIQHQDRFFCGYTNTTWFDPFTMLNRILDLLVVARLKGGSPVGVDS